MIPFNKPYLTGKEMHYMYDAVYQKKLSGNGKYTQRCQQFFSERYGFKKCLLTTSCTDALEMAAILIGIKEGDEVIMPSYTFVSTANAFALRGAKIVFADSSSTHPGIDEDAIEDLITERTRAIIPVHYAGVACNMDKIMDLANRYNLYVIEDAAQAIDSYYIDSLGVRRPLGSMGHMSAFSFHETKNIISGEGGMLVINDEKFLQRSEIIWEKGTNRSAFFRGEVDKYGWVDVGSSFLPSELIAAFLWAQLENMDDIQSKRLQHWNFYQTSLESWATENNLRLPYIPEFATNNAHMYYIIVKNANEREDILRRLKDNGILAVFHYLSLHKSQFFRNKYIGKELSHSDKYSECLIRLPLFYELRSSELQRVVDVLKSYK